ncbi:hypothetical protein CPB85DRAFT_892850 [Mucidula mucida]|nr:hypothetical protein CPB85DRAFT_892850 [Mucidula mucida]
MFVTTNEEAGRSRRDSEIPISIAVNSFNRVQGQGADSRDYSPQFERDKQASGRSMLFLVMFGYQWPPTYSFRVIVIARRGLSFCLVDVALVLVCKRYVFSDRGLCGRVAVHLGRTTRAVSFQPWDAKRIVIRHSASGNLLRFIGDSEDLCRH